MPSYVLKVTKFLGKVSQFEFLVMTEKNIFAYKLFLINFLCENCNPPEKIHSPPPFRKFGWRFNLSPPAERRGGAAHRPLPTNCLSMFDHFVRLALKGLIASFTGQLDCVRQKTCFRCFVVLEILIIGSYFIQYLFR